MLVVEGGLLVKHIDHDNAKAIDARLEAGLPILGCTTSKGSKGGNNQGAGTAALKSVAHNIPLRDQWRGGDV